MLVGNAVILSNKPVQLLDADGGVLWEGTSDDEGAVTASGFHGDVCAVADSEGRPICSTYPNPLIVRPGDSCRLLLRFALSEI